MGSYYLLNTVLCSFSGRRRISHAHAFAAQQIVFSVNAAALEQEWHTVSSISAAQGLLFEQVKQGKSNGAAVGRA